ncbi:AMP-binding protein [Frankia sp. ArI3]|uniref:AMP-binding protein n=1 Tax=Frankia sp. ArI3 TaxID=1858 RepID=UPI001C6FCBC6|nr:AMP-binding protein [Frankia sp. ArI3]
MYPGVFAEQSPHKPAVIVAGTGAVLTYGELEDASSRLARRLHEVGLRREDHLALLTDNDPRAFEVFWAALRSGLYITAVNRHLVADEIAYIIDDCGARGLVVSAALLDVAEQIVEATPQVGIRLVYGADAGASSTYGSYDEALASVPPGPLPHQPCGTDMLYSSGTTGRPKGIRDDLPEREVHEPGDPLVTLFGSMYDFGPDTVYLSPAPIYHAAPLRFGGWVHRHGGTVVLMDRFDAEGALAAIEHHRITHSQWVPTMFVRMLKLAPAVREKYDLSSHRVAVHAAAPCPPEVKRAMIDWWGSIIYEYYSSTEKAGATFITTEEWLRKPGSVGRPGMGIVRICGDDGAELPTGQVGTIFFERDVPAFEYHNDPAKTAAARHPDHPTWSTTGDVGYLDEDGYRVAGQCSGLQAGGEGPRGKAVSRPERALNRTGLFLDVPAEHVQRRATDRPGEVGA